MNDSLKFPINLVQWILKSVSRPVRSSGALLCALMLLLFVGSGVAYPASGDGPFVDPIEILGSFLLFSLLTPYLLMCMLAGIRANDLIHQQITPFLPAGFDQDRYQAIHYWPLPVLAAIAFALAGNVNWSTMVLTPGTEGFLTSLLLIAGQIVMWTMVGLVLFVSIHECWILGRLGKVVEINLYNLDALNGFGRAALNSFLMVVGALSLTIIQAIDREFRAENYINGLYVGLPAVIVLVAMPTWSLHRRIRRRRIEELAAIDEKIAHGNSALGDTDALVRFNALLQRRELVSSLRSWPMDTTIFSRFVLYVFIPPLAWVGAALVEFFLDSLLAA